MVRSRHSRERPIYGDDRADPNLICPSSAGWQIDGFFIAAALAIASIVFASFARSHNPRDSRVDTLCDRLPS